MNDSVEDWIEEFENVANFNNWANADEARSARLKAVAAHLKGEALDFYREKAADALRWHVDGGVNSSNTC